MQNKSQRKENSLKGDTYSANGRKREPPLRCGEFVKKGFYRESVCSLSSPFSIREEAGNESRRSEEGL
jgi:hypothetical protein